MTKSIGDETKSLGAAGAAIKQALMGIYMMGREDNELFERVGRAVDKYAFVKGANWAVAHDPRVVALVEALEFYADEGNLNWHYNDDRTAVSTNYEDDAGDIARSALANFKQDGG